MTNGKRNVFKPRGGLVDRALAYEREHLGFDPAWSTQLVFFHFIIIILLLDVEKVG